MQIAYMYINSLFVRLLFASTCTFFECFGDNIDNNGIN